MTCLEKVSISFVDILRLDSKTIVRFISTCTTSLSSDKVEVPVTSIEYFTDEVVNVYQLSCEPYDWFFVSGILIHNK